MNFPLLSRHAFLQMTLLVLAMATPTTSIDESPATATNPSADDHSLADSMRHLQSMSSDFCGFPQDILGDDVNPFLEPRQHCNDVANTDNECESSSFFSAYQCRWENGRCTSDADLTGEDTTCPSIADEGQCAARDPWAGSRSCVWYEITQSPSQSPSQAPSAAPYFCGFPQDILGDNQDPFLEPRQYCNSLVATEDDCESSSFTSAYRCRWENGRCTSDADLTGEDTTCPSITDEGQCVARDPWAGSRSCVWYEITQSPSQSPSQAPSAAPYFCGFPQDILGDDQYPFLEPRQYCNNLASTENVCESTTFISSYQCRWEDRRCTSDAERTGEDSTCPLIPSRRRCQATTWSGPRSCVWYEPTPAPSESPSEAPSAVPYFCGFPQDIIGNDTDPFLEPRQYCNDIADTENDCETTSFSSVYQCRWENRRCTSDADSTGEDQMCPPLPSRRRCEATTWAGPRACVWYAPTSAPSSQPSMPPSSSAMPSTSEAPSYDPSMEPSISLRPSLAPSNYPSVSPSNTLTPSHGPSVGPSSSLRPSLAPSVAPTESVNIPSMQPSQFPTIPPSGSPNQSPRQSPSAAPTASPSSLITDSPTVLPTFQPTRRPTETPTQRPTRAPTRRPTRMPTQRPTTSPTERPTPRPSVDPIPEPTQAPSMLPTTDEPTTTPTPLPTVNPTDAPRPNPTMAPTPATPIPTAPPTPTPTARPTTPQPSSRPTRAPTPTPTLSPTTARPTRRPTLFPTPFPTPIPTRTDPPTPQPTEQFAPGQRLVTACQCDTDGRTCVSEPVEQHSSVYLCLRVDHRNVEFVDIQDLQFLQDGNIKDQPIERFSRSSKTFVSVEGRSVLIRSELDESFYTTIFNNDIPADVHADGVAVLAITDNQGNRNLEEINLRLLQSDNGSFDVDFPLEAVTDDSLNSGSNNKSKSNNNDDNPWTWTAIFIILGVAIAGFIMLMALKRARSQFAARAAQRAATTRAAAANQQNQAPPYVVPPGGPIMMVPAGQMMAAPVQAPPAQPMLHNMFIRLVDLD